MCPLSPQEVAQEFLTFTKTPDGQDEDVPNPTAVTA